MNRFFQVLLIVSWTGFSWLAMMVVHELGHVWHAWLSGGTVTKVVLHPATFSRTDVSPNPHPLFVAWGGAVWGCLLPLGVLAAARWLAPASTYLAAYFAGFCLIANGAYLAAGSSIAGGHDAGVMLVRGGAPWQTVVFGVAAVATGLYLCRGLGPAFGLGAAQGKVDRSAAVGAAAALLILATAELILAR